MNELKRTPTLSVVKKKKSIAVVGKREGGSWKYSDRWESKQEGVHGRAIVKIMTTSLLVVYNGLKKGA